MKLNKLPFTSPCFHSFVSLNSEMIPNRTHLIVGEQTVPRNVDSGEYDYGDGAAWIRGSMIGKGSYGCVYLATLKNPASKNSCFPPLMAIKSAEISASGSIQKEREVFSKFKGCPNIIDCYGDETTTGANGMMAYNMLLEYAAGGSLANRIKKSGEGGLPEIEAKLYTRSILKGLKHIHRSGYVYCDLKPDNILLVNRIEGNVDGGFRAKIGDFGVTNKRNELKKRKFKGYYEGNPMYLSPEAVIDNVQEASFDVWALGCIVLEMLTGKTVLDGGRELGFEGILGNTVVSKDARAFLKGCFVKNPMFRFTAEMLLCHKFLEGLDDDVVEEFALKVDIRSISLVYEPSCESWSDGDEDGLLPFLEEDEGSRDDDVSSITCAEEKSNSDESTQSLLKRRKHDATSFGIHVGM